MTLWKLFTASLSSPKKLAAFRLAPMGKTMQYIFLFITLFTLLGFFQFTTQIGPSTSELDGVLDYFNEINWLLYPFAFLLLFIIQTLLIFARISLLSGIVWLLAPLVKKRGDYRFLWRTTLFANTWSFLLLLVSYMFIGDIVSIQWLSYALTLIFALWALKYYPKLPKKS